MDERYDVVVVGGGAAGLNGALMLARSRRSVLVVDAGAPRNAPASGVHGLLGREGTPPGELLATGRAEVRGYGGRIEEGEVRSARRVGGGFEVSLTDGRRVRARRLLVTTGLTDELPDVPGLRERWGRAGRCRFTRRYSSASSARTSPASSRAPRSRTSRPSSSRRAASRWSTARWRVSRSSTTG